MTLLGIDTSTKKANVCVSINDVYTSKSIDNEITHSEKLLPLVDNCFKEVDLKLKDMDMLACTTGPGSFTGIRIAISTMKAFAKVINKPIFAISSLDVLAYSKINKNISYAISMLDAKNSRVYYALYKVSHLKHYTYTFPILIPLCNYSNDKIDIALDNINDTLLREDISQGKLLVTGDIALSHEELVLNKLHYLFKDIDCVNSSLDAKTLNELVNNYTLLGYDKDYTCDYSILDALYVRPSQAERYKNNED